MTYRERRVPGAGLACVWSREYSGTGESRIVPDACVDVIWHRESGRLWVAGPDTGPQVHVSEPGMLVGLRFRPGDTALGVPADALRDARVALADLWPRAAELGERLASASDVVAAQEVLVAALPAAPDPVVAVIRGLAAEGGSVRGIADALGMSERQLRRRARAAFGYGPKMLHRVLRFQRALGLARAGVAFGDVAYAAGYADQAHLAREVRGLAGVPLGDVVRG
ncbi:helix-turn-helix domain-containing protein [Actinokineospora iranica]|uniref:AraC-type DNA-binding protein n=1 Tax=Actinokineospora iranica TaxID=1271860 RepID=A0A1G6KN83_9PSEU|nr:helix-turn-helix domain-containing protein [Actinokineospora iranica]SDC32281.1 AraC-type DNA-binding protein [Actinokineospora iranica]